MLGESGIYMIKNTVTGKVYIGGTVNFDKRFGEHLAMLRGGYHHSLKLQRSYNKHGESAFTFSVLECVADKNDLDEIEQKWIDKYAAHVSGYNMLQFAGRALGNKGIKGQKRSIESIKKQIAKNIGRKNTKETLLKMSVAAMGKKPTPETIKKRIKTLEEKERESPGYFVNAIRKGRVSSKNTTGVKGVMWSKQVGKYQAQITTNGKRVHLGTFETFDDAKHARLNAQEKFWGCSDTQGEAYQR